jgi:hypothetical protein
MKNFLTRVPRIDAEAVSIIFRLKTLLMNKTGFSLQNPKRTRHLPFQTIASIITRSWSIR